MDNPCRRKLMSLAAVAPFAGKVLSANTGGPEPQAAARERIHRRYFPDVVLRKQDKKKVRFYEDVIKDKIVTLNFFYAECDGVCPGLTDNLGKVQQSLTERGGRQFLI